MQRTSLSALATSAALLLTASAYSGGVNMGADADIRPEEELLPFAPYDLRAGPTFIEGTSGSCTTADVNLDYSVDFADILYVIHHWDQPVLGDTSSERYGFALLLDVISELGVICYR